MFRGFGVTPMPNGQPKLPEWIRIGRDAATLTAAGVPKSAAGVVATGSQCAPTRWCSTRRSAGRRMRCAIQFETVSRMSEREQQMVRELLDAVIVVKNQVAGALERVNKPEAKERRTRVRGKA
jgi:hypothetical protein